ncbi:MAG TPA: beta-ketoacyl synthase N-terminal-like domain-containing protein, partial [Vicingus sp.]|nr:beta-ketoacyl synthase N-terminal-like domain-containing protein [Vicingus sp.]
MKEVYIIAAARTPIGSFMGSLSTVEAPKLGAAAIKGALKKANISADVVDEVFMGNVLQANVGQAPARQAAIFAGLNQSVPCTTVNKVCASGMKAIMLGAQTIMAGDNHCVVVGGMENMSLVPHYYNARNGVKLGDIKLIDGMVKDGLTDVYNRVHMGVCAEKCATEYKLTREEQDNF